MNTDYIGHKQGYAPYKVLKEAFDNALKVQWPFSKSGFDDAQSVWNLKLNILNLDLNKKSGFFCSCGKAFVCLSGKSPVSQWLSLVSHILTSLYLFPLKVLTLTMFLISGNNQPSHPPIPLNIPPLLSCCCWGHKPHGNRLSLPSALSDCWHEKIPLQWKYFPSPNTDIGLHGPTSLSPVG